MFGSRRSHRAIPAGDSGYLGYPTYFFADTPEKDYRNLGRNQNNRYVCMTFIFKPKELWQHT